MEREQIIKALECCSKDDCDNCPNAFGNCYANLAGYALSIIRELIEENERINLEYAGFEAGARHAVAFAKADTVRKMANRLKAVAYQSSDWSHGEHPMVVEIEDIDQIAEEMLDGAESFGIMDKVKGRMEEQRTTPKCKHYKRTSDDSTCVSCGMTIPEGRQVCSGCINNIKEWIL